MILVLSVSPKGERLKKALEELGEEVVIITEQVEREHIDRYKPEFVVSHGYDKLVGAEVISLMEGHIINTHPSMLPINRGMFPNFWSFIYDTPKGFTIHELTSKIDAGGILIQREFEFDVKKETFQTTYTAIEDSLHETLIQNWEQLKKGLIKPVPQQGKSTFHNRNKFIQFKEKIPFNWDDNIYEFLLKNEERIRDFLKSYQQFGK